jgi:hypothetical protein
MIGEFGVGMSLTSDLGGASRVDEAAIINGIVRVEEDSDVRARFLFEWHVAMICEHLDWNVEDVPPYQSDLDPEDAGEKSVRKQRPPCRPDRRSSGFFVAVQPGEDVIDAIGLGWMWRFPDKLQLLGNRTLNIGFGLMSDQNVKVLGDGFEENEPPPPGETEIRYRTTDQTGFLFMASIELGNAD